MSKEKDVIFFAYSSRFILITLQYLANEFIPDHKAHVFEYVATQFYGSQYQETIFDQLTKHFLGGFVRWDAHYFMHIAKYGYTYENTTAFFPFYPFACRCIAYLFIPAFGKQSEDSLLLITYIVMNILIFKESALVLYRLTKALFNEDIALESAILFCINPASIFFVAPYTETLFSYFTFTGMLGCVKLYRKYLEYQYDLAISDLSVLIPLSLSSLVRSNGIINIFFLLYTLICKAKVSKTRLHCTVCNLSIIIRYTSLAFVSIMIHSLPFVFYQYYCFQAFCKTLLIEYPKDIINQALQHHLILAGDNYKHKQPWCTSRIPLAYSYVQDYYWNIGFLKYYQLKQIPNFLVASPILIIIVSNAVTHLHVNYDKKRRLTWIFSMANNKNKRIVEKQKQDGNNLDCYILFQPKLTVFFIHALFLSLFCIFFMHIQVATRLLCSASPILYWICSSHHVSLGTYKNGLESLIYYAYFLLYIFVGTCLFCNFYPWT